MYFMEKPEWELIISGLPKSRDNLFRAIKMSNGNRKDIQLISAFRAYEARCRTLRNHWRMGTEMPFNEKTLIAIHCGYMYNVAAACRIKLSKTVDTSNLVDYLYHAASDSYIHPNLYVADKMYDTIGERYDSLETFLNKASDAEMLTVIECVRVFAAHDVKNKMYMEIVTGIVERYPSLYIQPTLN
jgi:hypothetical protein